MNSQTKKVLILGGGFGGIKAALSLSDSPFQITVITDHDDFRYYPALYKAATGGSVLAATIPLQEIFAGKDIKVVTDSAKQIDKGLKTVETASGKEYGYDILIVALGVVTNYFGISGLAQYAYGIKSMEEAKRLRDHIHKVLLDERKPDQNYVVIGGGATGVELAGALPGYIRSIMRKHGIKDKKLHIDLVEAAPRLMPRMGAKYSKALQKRLRRLGVSLHLAQTVEAETADSLMVSGHSISSHTVVWTAGVTNHPFLKDNGFNLNEHGKVRVDAYLRADPDIFVIGDNADTTYSGMAQTALYDAIFVANNLKRQVRGKNLKEYTPKKPIYITPVGPHWAAVTWGKLQFYGRIGSLLREAADFVGYHDLEPFWKASKHWMAESEKDHSCPVCADK